MTLFIVMTVLLLAAAGFVYYTNRHGQPKGLIPAALANMGERFGFYIMMAILTLFISSKFSSSHRNSVSTRLRQV